MHMVSRSGARVASAFGSLRYHARRPIATGGGSYRSLNVNDSIHSSAVRQDRSFTCRGTWPVVLEVERSVPRRPRVFVQTFGGCKPRHSACCCWYHTARARPLGSDCVGARECKRRHFHRRRRRDARGLRADAQPHWLSVYTQVTGEGEQCARVVYMPFRHALPTTVTPKM